jgi:cbb3-type cytochrome oxidase cytochrome c subunit
MTDANAPTIAMVPDLARNGSRNTNATYTTHTYPPRGVVATTLNVA